MQFALIDDADAERKLAMCLFSDYASRMQLNITVKAFESGEAFLSSFTPYAYDIIFMDIYMPGMNGIEAARKLRETDNRSLLVFLTSSDAHMGNAFSVHAFDYIEKPLEHDRFFACLTDCLAVLPKPEKYLTFSSGRLDIRLYYSEIACLSSSGHSTIVQCVSGREYTVYAAFSAFTKGISQEEGFLLVSRGVLVNMEHISCFEENRCILQNGMSVPVTQRKLRQLTQLWHNYNFSKLHKAMPERS